MSIRNDQILRALQTGEQSSSNLALITGAPEPSVRRSIQELRRNGHNISFAGAPTYVYRLGQSTMPTVIAKQTEPNEPVFIDPPTSNATNAYDLLLDVRQAIIDEPKRLDMSIVCVRGVTLTHAFVWDSDSQRAQRAKWESPACGTVGCLAGWALTLKGRTKPDENNRGYMDNAEVLLGLTPIQAEELFTPDALITAKNKQSQIHVDATVAHLDAFMVKNAKQLLSTRV